MTQLQQFDFRSSRYERPNQPWVCGRLAEGRPCEIGPDHRGRCRALGECRPKRDGDRWICTRPPLQGGTCSVGPLPDGSCSCRVEPCVPARSVRARRGILAAWMVALTIGILVVVLQSPQASRLLSPGPLTLAHGDIGPCQTCHVDVGDGPVGWLHAAFTPLDPAAGSKPCLACHDVGAMPLNPHGLPAEELDRITDQAQAAGGDSPPVTLTAASAVFSPPREAAPDGLACGSCHDEHRGQDFNLATMGNDTCQSCHSVRFAAFADGHPGFGSYPYERRTRIIFDHVSHISRHFEKAGMDKAPETCTSCHEPSANGELMVVKDFSGVCAGCHIGQITGPDHVGTKGIAFFSVPGLDLFELRAQRADIGEWPEWSEQPLSPFMALLLAQDPETKAAIEQLEALDALDLTDIDEAGLKAVETVAWAVKGLLHDLIAEGVPVLKARLDETMPGMLDRTALTRMLGALPLDVALSAQREWFPNLFDEVARHRRGEVLPVPGSEPEAAEGEGGDESADEGDEVEAQDVEPAPLAEPAESAFPGGAFPGGDDEIPDEGGDILGADDGADEGGILGADEGADEGGILGADEGADDGGILGADEDADEGGILGADEGADEGGILGADEGADEGGILGADDDGSEGLAAPLGGDEAGADEEEEAAEAAAPVGPPELDQESWAELGGWYRRDYALYYRPLDHADRFMRTWLDLSGHGYGTPVEALARPVFETLAADNSPGACTKCHAVDHESDGSLNLKWRPLLPNPEIKKATQFSHTTHFSLLDEQGCLTCHQITPGNDYQASFKDHDAETFASNFKPMQVDVCQDCHVPSAAGDTCILCHQYHVGRVVTRNVATKMFDSMKEEHSGEEAPEPEASGESEAEATDAPAEEPAAEQ